MRISVYSECFQVSMYRNVKKHARFGKHILSSLFFVGLHKRRCFTQKLGVCVQKSCRYTQTFGQNLDSHCFLCLAYNIGFGHLDMMHRQHREN